MIKNKKQLENLRRLTSMHITYTNSNDHLPGFPHAFFKIKKKEKEKGYKPTGKHPIKKEGNHRTL